MATYKEIKGVTLQTKDSDPVLNVGSWASGGDLNQAKKQLGGAGLTPTASIVFGGVQASPPSLGTTESYNGTSWTELNDMPQVSQYLAGVGTSTAAVAIAGIGGPGDSPKGDYIQEWNGSSWSNNPNAYPFAGYSLAGAGTATAAIISGGDPARTDVNTFDGTSFTSSTAMNTGRRGHGSVGTTTANLVFCGETPRTANTELWNGSSWTEVNDYPAATQDLSYWGTSTSAIGALGYDTANSANSASWDGTSWTETADLSTARNGANRGGLGTNNTEGLVAGGDDSGVKSNTEEFGFPPPTAAVLTEGDIFLSGGTTLKGFGRAAGVPTGTWASGGDLNTARRVYDSMNGTQSASKAISGFTPPDNSSTSVEDYNGTSWTETTEVNTARYSGAAAGNTSASSILFGGYIPSPPSYVTNTETWNGSSWTEVNELNTARGNLGGNGSQTSALTYGGQPITGKTESWDGTSWTEVSDLNRTRHDMAAIGASNTSALAAGGQYPPNQRGNQVETWDGSSWTEVNELNTGREQLGGSGTKDLAIAFGGTPNGSTFIGNTEAWNGSSWTEISDLATGRATLGSSGSAATGLAAGGHTPSLSAATEEFTAPATLSTVTVS